jgi:Holliday junction DNA helicase RuvB
MGVNIKNTSGPTIEKAGDLAGLLTTLERGDVLFIDEIHALSRIIEEYLYPAMEDYKLDIIIDQGPNARSVRLNLPKFTLIGATTRSGMISAPLRSRFGMPLRLDYYTAYELQSIVQRSAGLIGVDVDSPGALEIAARSRGTPRIANNLLRWTRDFAQVRAGNRVTREVADAALTMRDIDRDGLDETDKRILETLVHKFGGGPVGLNSLAVAIGEDPGTLEDVAALARSFDHDVELLTHLRLAGKLAEGGWSQRDVKRRVGRVGYLAELMIGHADDFRRTATQSARRSLI